MSNDALVMGILNVTPDSFSDGGLYHAPDTALNHAERLLQEGADIIDVGGESTRPGAPPVPLETELQRVVPVVREINRRWPATTISIDTRKFEVAQATIDQGATIINDISGGTDVRLVPLLSSDVRLKIILMHMQGTPQMMQNTPAYPRGVVREISEFLAVRVQSFTECGIETSRLWVDPGIGFGKTLDHNLEILRSLSSFSSTGGRLVIGTSRKSFLAGLLGEPGAPHDRREAGTLASSLWAWLQGASVFRMHQVGEFYRALKTFQAIAGKK